MHKNTLPYLGGQRVCYEKTHGEVGLFVYLFYHLKLHQTTERMFERNGTIWLRSLEMEYIPIS